MRKRHLVISIICFLILVLSMGYFFMYFPSMPQRIPIHYNLKGAIEGYGPKDMVMAMNVVEVLIVVGITAIEQFPELWSSHIREEVRTKVNTMILDMIEIIKLELCLLFAYLTYMLVMMQYPGIGFYLFLVLVVVTLIMGIINIRRILK